VSYTNQVPDKKYLQENKFPAGTRVQISALDILNGLVIEEKGSFAQSGVGSTWSRESIFLAARRMMLPSKMRACLVKRIPELGEGLLRQIIIRQHLRQLLPDQYRDLVHIRLIVEIPVSSITTH